MPPIVNAKIPRNQLNALPLIDAQTVALAGDVTILGKTFSRYWSPTVLGISGVNFLADGGGAGGTYLATPFLDVRGCKSFMMLFRRNNAILAPANPDFFLWVQYRFTSAEVPLLSQAGDRLTYIGGYILNNQTISFPAFQTAGETQTAPRGWNVGQESLAADDPKTIGTDARIVITCTATPAVTNTYSMVVWCTG